MTWPDPAATALDRARAIARTYRDALAKAAPHQAEVFDSAARQVGEAWVCGVDTGDRTCTVSAAAQMLGVSDSRVRQLIGASDLPTAGKTSSGWVLHVSDVLAYQQRQRTVADRDANGLTCPASGTAAPTGR